MDVKLGFTHGAKSNTYAADPIPSMALDSGSPCRNDGFHAKMRIADRRSDHINSPVNCVVLTSRLLIQSVAVL